MAGGYPIVGSVAITVLTGLGLQLTYLIGFQEHMSGVVGWLDRRSAARPLPELRRMRTLSASESSV